MSSTMNSYAETFVHGDVAVAAVGVIKPWITCGGSNVIVNCGRSGEAYHAAMKALDLFFEHRPEYKGTMG
jgi:hypothetical protein